MRDRKSLRPAGGHQPKRIGKTAPHRAQGKNGFTPIRAGGERKRGKYIRGTYMIVDILRKGRWLAIHTEVIV